MVKAPNQTTVNKDEYIPEHGTIPFAPELVELISKKQKLTTYRFGDKYGYLNVGDCVNIQNSQTKVVTGKAQITGKKKVTFGQLPLGLEGHETYKDKNHQRKVFSGYYAYLGRSINDGDEFLVLSFKLL